MHVCSLILNHSNLKGVRLSSNKQVIPNSESLLVLLYLIINKIWCCMIRPPDQSPWLSTLTSKSQTIEIVTVRTTSLPHSLCSTVLIVLTQGTNCKVEPNEISMLLSKGACDLNSTSMHCTPPLSVFKVSCHHIQKHFFCVQH